MRWFRTGFHALLLLLLGTAVWFRPAAAQNVSNSFTPYVSAVDLRDLERDGHGNLWIATQGGALRFELATGTWEHFPRLLGTGPRGNDLATVGVDRLGQVWVGSATRGFTFYDPATGIWDRESVEWPDPRIKVIRCFGGGVYIGTENGLSLKPTPNRTDFCADSDPGCIVPSYVVNDYALLGDTLWVATEGGLGRFNGDTWDSAGALPSGSIGQRSRSLAVFQGTLWEVTSDPRIRRLVDGVWIAASLPVNRLTVSDGRLYAFGGTHVYRWEGAAWTELHPPLAAGDEIRDLEVFGQDFYFALNGSLALWPGGPEFTRRYIPPGPRFSGPYSALAVDGDGALWGGTSEVDLGLVRFDGTSWLGIRPPEQNLIEQWILGMFRSGDDAIWLGHCCCFDPESCPLQRVNADGVAIFRDVLNAWAFAEDAGNRLWIGTQKGGVQVRDLATEGLLFGLTVQNTGGALSSNTVTAVAVTAGETYIGNESAGLDIWPHGGNLTQGRDGTGWIHIGETPSGLLDEGVKSMTFRDGDLWVATTSGLHRLRDLTVQQRCPSRDRNTPGDPIRKINAIAADGQGGLWVATDGGLLYHARGGACDASGGDFLNFTTENSPLPADRVVSAVLNPVDGSMWFGTTVGLLRVDPLAFTGSPPPPDRFVLYPNPIYPGGNSAPLRSVIFGIERSGLRVEPVSAAISTQPRVYDLAGRHVGDFERVIGTAEDSWLWRGKNRNGDTVAPGIYLVRTNVDGEPVTLKVGVVR